MNAHTTPSKTLSAVHRRVTGELLHLMDGLFANVEDGLFELAYRADHETQKRRCFDLMREMRFQRSRLVQSFARRMQSGFDAWLNDGGDPAPANDALDVMARRMARKCTSHFGGVLQAVTERANDALGRDQSRSELPIGPHRIARCFVDAMRALNFDEASIEVIEELFGRFVLERLGSVYGDCNAQLADAGFYTAEELKELSRARA
jgi:hypothetical protein